MINLPGQLWATSDINLVNQAYANGFKVLYLGDPVSMDPAYKDIFIMATSLIPDYNAMSMQVDGNEQGFIQMYTASLSSKAAMEMISVIIAGLYSGKNIIMFLPPEASGLNFIQYLLQFIHYNYGIETQTKSTAYSFDPTFSSKIAELLYLNSFINAQNFLIASDSIDDLVLRKLVNELRPAVKDPRDINQILKWFSDFKNALLSSNKQLVNGLQYAGEVSDYSCY